MRASKKVDKISIAMTTYNGERFIREQLCSLKNQTLRADEVVIFDDCSSDRTVEIIKAFINEFDLDWELSVNEHNHGYIENFYKAIQATTGDIIFLSDQDDVWHLEKIETMVGLFQEHKDLQVLSTGFRKIDEHGNPIATKQKLGYTNHGLIKGHIRKLGLKRIGFQNIFRVNISPGCTAAFAKKCKELYIDNATGQWCHDWELCIFGGMIDGLFFYNEALTDYRLHGNNTIGLKDTMTGSLHNDDRYTRLELAQMECERTDLYMTQALLDTMGDKNRKILRRYWRFTSSRVKALENDRLSAWLQCMRHLTTYLKAVRIRGVIGDLLYIVNHLGRRETVNE